MAEPTYITRGLLLRWRERLNKRLPGMVDWFDPILLGLVGVRTLISTTIGQYADQRPVQAAMDPEPDKKKLALRHDYSDAQATKALAFDKDGALWVDFIADLGDGFEATYAMAYLMASSTLKVRGADTPDQALTGGEILIFGGDLAYPNATVKEYQERCLDPFNATLPAPLPGPQTRVATQKDKKLFFIAGNHDWYDGLAAFTSVFCAASSEDPGTKIGKWRCEQRRSYFALKLPHNWWIWGIDTGLSDSIDEAQKRYFDEVAERTTAKDKIIVVTHAPAWVDRLDKSLTVITELVRQNAKEEDGKKGPQICAVIAGDLHHYSRYVSEQKGSPPMHLITSGGGGAFLHPTHQLKKTVYVGFTGADSASAGQVKRRKRDLRRGQVTRDHPVREKKVYPSKWRSRMLTLKNLWLPFRNRRFAVLLGLIYFLYAWTYNVALTENPLPPRLPQIAEEEATAADNFALAATSLAQPVLDRFLDLARQQTAAPDLKAAAAAAKKATDNTKRAVASVRAAVDKRAAAEAALKRAKEASEKAGEASKAAPSTAATAAAEAAEKIKEDADQAFTQAEKESKSAPSKEDVVRKRASAYKEADNAIVLAYKAFAEFHSASSKLTGQPSTADLANAAAQARVIVGQAQSAVAHAKKINARSEALKAHKERYEKQKQQKYEKKSLFTAALNSPAFFFMLLALWFGLVHYVDTTLLTGAWHSWLNWPVKVGLGTYHFVLHMGGLLSVFWFAQHVENVTAVVAAVADGINDPIGVGATFETCWTVKWSGWNGFGHCLLNEAGGLGPRIAVFLALATTSIILGGILGGVIFGIYWVTTTAVFGMHMDAFSALGLKDYKNFLRMRFDKSGALTIYAIGLDHVPGPKGWRARGDVVLPDPDYKPQIVPKRPLQPYVIEKIVIARDG